MAPARVLNVGHHYRVAGGSDRYMLVLEALLEERGHEVIPFAAAHPDNQPTPWARFFPTGVDPEGRRPSDFARFFYSREAAQALASLLKEARPDLAHLHIYYGHLTTSILAEFRKAGVPVVQTLHDYKLACPVYSFLSNGTPCEACGGHQFWKALPRRCNRGSLARTVASVAEAYIARATGDLRHIDHFITVCDFQRSKLLSYGLGTGKMSTVHNFVDAAAFTPGTAPGDYALYFGRLEALKGVHTLIEAAARVPELPLLVVGDGKERAALEARVAELGADHIRFLGFQRGARLHDLIRESRVCLQPSECYELCPMSTLEAMAFARPLIGSDIGGIPELVAEGQTGLLVPPGDTDALSAAIRWMAAHPGEAQRMGRAGRARAEREFGPDRHYARLREVYAGLL
ncbi:MAG: glycosyltransferase family 4 protein [Bacteroidota bacterium]